MALPKRLEGRLRLPVIGSPLFIVSGPDLVIAQCKAGIIGSFPALNARPQLALGAWIVQIKAALAESELAHGPPLSAPFAVNQICHPSNDRLMDDMATCVEHRVPIIITSLQVPRAVVDATHGYDGLVFHDVTNVRHARRAIDHGADGLILVCAGAGGHAGTLSPFALVREIRAWYDGPVILGGAIADGWSVAGALAMGADLAYVGTRFIASAEAIADAGYKQMLIDHAPDDIVYSSLFTGVNGNYLKPSIAAAGLDPNALPAADKSTMDFSSKGNMKIKAWRDIWAAGQGLTPIVDAPPVADLVERMRREFDDARRALAVPALVAV